MKYAPALDGLRAVAILAVLLFHALPGTLEGGFTGVDVFFVLSGYLISSVVLHEMRARRFSMREFYLRRIQRLLPNAAVMILVTVLLSSMALLPSAVPRIAEHGLWTLFNLSNIYIWKHFGGYWGDLAASSPLLHTWSLAVEEQFYLVFPATLWLLVRRKRPNVFAATAALAVASFGLSLYGTWAFPTETFYLLPARAWEPLLGAALATWRVPASAELPARSFAPSWTTELAGWAGLAMIAAGFFVATEAHSFPGGIALLPTVGTLAVLVSIADGQTRPARLLAKPALVWVGKLSYSLYLWHWPLIVISRTYCELNGQSPEVGTLVGASLSVVLSAVAYWAVEQPLRRRGPGRGRRLVIVAAGFSLCAITGLLVSLRHPVLDPFEVFERPVYEGQLYNAIAKGSAAAMLSATKYSDVVVPPADQHSPLVWKTGGVVHGWGLGAPRVVVLGSSHALMYARLIDDICRQLDLPVAFLSAHATSVFFDQEAASMSFDAARRKWLREWRPELVIVIDRWDGRVVDHAPGDFDRRLRELVAELEPNTQRILLFSQVPVLRLGEKVNLREFVTWKLGKTGSLPRISPDAKEALRKGILATIEAVAREHPKVQLLRVDPPFYLPDGSVKYSSGRNFFYLDDDHLSAAGAESVRGLCMQAIAGAFAP